MKSNQSAWGRSSAARIDEDLGHEKTNVTENVVPHYEENLEEPTMRADTGGNLLASPPRHGTLDEPTVDRGNYGSGNVHGSPMESTLPPTMIGQLVVTDGNDMGNVYPMTGLPMSVGRALGNDVVLTDIAVSRKHMSIEFNGRQYKLIDLGSGNGTLINDRLETGTCLLHHGDRLELGNTIFRFEHPATRGVVLNDDADDDLATQSNEDAFDEEASTVVGHSKPNNISAASSSPIAHPAGRRRKRVTLPPAQGGEGRGLPNLNKNLPLRDNGAENHEPLGAVLREQASPLSSSEPFGADGPLGAVAAPPPVSLPRPPGGRLNSMLAVSNGTGPAQAMSLAPGSAGPVPGFESSDPMLVGLPGNRLGSEFGDIPSLKKSRGGLIVGILAVAVIGVGAAIGFLLLRPRGGQQVAEKPSAAAQTRARSLPSSTWGTNESALVASTRKSIPEPTVDDSATKPEGDKPAGDTSNGASTAPEPGAGVTDPEAGKTDEGKPDTGEPDNGTKTDQSTQQSGDQSGENTASKTGNQKTTKTVKTAKKTSKKKTSKRPSSKVRAAAARNSAKSKYRSKQFSAAAKLLRNAAGSLSKKDASSLRSLASRYETIGTQMSKGNSNQAKNPAAALSAYEKAYKADKSAGGAHSSFLRGKLQKVAPKAAANHLAKKRYESAKIAADKAATYGAGKSTLVKRVRSNLETKAQAFYKAALKDKRKNPAQAKKNLQRILKMVPKSSKNYGKALNLLSKIK